MGCPHRARLVGAIPRPPGAGVDQPCPPQGGRASRGPGRGGTAPPGGDREVGVCYLINSSRVRLRGTMRLSGGSQIASLAPFCGESARNSARRAQAGSEQRPARGGRLCQDRTLLAHS